VPPVQPRLDWNGGQPFPQPKPAPRPTPAPPPAPPPAVPKAANSARNPAYSATGGEVASSEYAALRRTVEVMLAEAHAEADADGGGRDEEANDDDDDDDDDDPREQFEVDVAKNTSSCLACQGRHRPHTCAFVARRHHSGTAYQEQQQLLLPTSDLGSRKSSKLPVDHGAASAAASSAAAAHSKPQSAGARRLRKMITPRNRREEHRMLALAIRESKGLPPLPPPSVAVDEPDAPPMPPPAVPVASSSEMAAGGTSRSGKRSRSGPSGSRRPRPFGSRRRVPRPVPAVQEAQEEGPAPEPRRAGPPPVFIPQSAYMCKLKPMSDDEEEMEGVPAMDDCLICRSRTYLLLCFGHRGANMKTGAAEQAHTVCKNCLDRWFSAHNELRVGVGLLPHSRHSCPVCRCLLRGSSLRSSKHCLGLLKVRETWPETDYGDNEEEAEAPIPGRATPEAVLKSAEADDMGYALVGEEDYDEEAGEEEGEENEDEAEELVGEDEDEEGEEEEGEEEYEDELEGEAGEDEVMSIPPAGNKATLRTSGRARGDVKAPRRTHSRVPIYEPPVRRSGFRKHELLH